MSVPIDDRVPRHRSPRIPGVDAPASVAMGLG
jgi:hypothetical protein